MISEIKVKQTVKLIGGSNSAVTKLPRTFFYIFMPLISSELDP